MEEFASLLNDAGTGGGNQYCGFLGSVRARPGCPILLSIRPSNGYMQSSFCTPEQKLPLVPEPICRYGNRLYPIHFTDIFKFRQRYSSDSPFENMDSTGWQLAIECLADFYKSLQIGRFDQERVGTHFVSDVYIAHVVGGG